MEAVLAGNAARSRSVLVVENVDTLRKVMAFFLREAGYVMFEAGIATQAMAVVTTNKLDAIIMDVGLPIMDGCTLTRQIRKIPKMKNIPIIFCSGYGSDEDITKAMNAGGTDYIVKPFKSVEFVRRIQNAIERKDIAELQDCSQV